MRRFAMLLCVAALACSPTAPTETADDASGAADASAAAQQTALGPYVNSWDAAEFSRFRHVLYVETPGERTITLTAHTDSPGGETVAVYPVGPDGERRTARILFVVADGDGETATDTLEFPADGSGVPVEVVVENAGGRRHAGDYRLTIE